MPSDRAQASGEGELLLNDGKDLTEVEHRAKLGRAVSGRGMKADDAKGLRQLDSENARCVAETEMNKAMVPHLRLWRRCKSVRAILGI